jgi:glycerol-3-phosphate dehydrogenase
MYGTSHDPYEAPPDEAQPGGEPVEALLHDINRAFPGAPVSMDEVALVHWGLLPSVPARGPHVELSKHSLVQDHRADGVEGLVTVIGVRYTTARQTAQQAVDLASAHLGGGSRECRTAETPLVGGDVGALAAVGHEVRRAWAEAADPDVTRLVHSYGSRVAEVLALLAEPGGRAPLSGECAVTAAEVRHAARREMAMTLPDVLVRRTEAGSAGHPGAEAASAAAAVMAGELGWSPQRTAAEVECLAAYYAPVRVPAG